MSKHKLFALIFVYMKKHYLLLLCMVLIGHLASAQSDRFRKKNSKPKEAPQEETQRETPKPPPAPENFFDRLVYGGGAGLSFGNNTNIFLAPQVGYQINDNWVAGVGYMYNYARWNQILTTQGWVEVDFENQIHGPNIFTNYNFLNTLFVGTQLELLNNDLYTYNNINGDFDISNTWTPVLFVQGGFFQRIGNSGAMQIGLRLNLLHDENSPYATSWAPIFQVFF